VGSVETEIVKHGKLVSRDDRYLVSSLPDCRLSQEHWLSVVRRRWGVETAHQSLHTAFAEDDHPWIEAHPRGALVVAMLRRIAYTLLFLFRSVTQRSDQRRSVPLEAPHDRPALRAHDQHGRAVRRLRPHTLLLR
jgi:hypothetical protein